MAKENEKKARIDEKQLVIFKLAKEEFGVEISEVKEIIKMEDITVIPNVEDHIKGVINLRGKIIVILSLAKKLNLQQKDSDKDTRIVIIEIGDTVVGMIVDSVEEVLRVTTDKISATPDMISKDINQEYLQGVCILDKRLIILLDLTKLVSTKDIEHINKVVQDKN